MSVHRSWECPCTTCWRKNSVVFQRRYAVNNSSINSYYRFYSPNTNSNFNFFNMSSQQPNYGAENSWDLMTKAAAVATAAASVNPSSYNGYPMPATGGGGAAIYHRQSSLTNNSNGSHHANAQNAGNGPNVTGVAGQPWRGVQLPTAPSNSGESWSPNAGTLSPSSLAAAQSLYSGNTTSYFATTGGGSGTGGQGPSPLRVSASNPNAVTVGATNILSPTSPMISPQAASSNQWPSSKSHHQFHLPQIQSSSSSSSEQQRSPHHLLQQPQHGFNHNQFTIYNTNSTTPSAAATAVQSSTTVTDTDPNSAYEKLLEAVAIQAARVPFNQPYQSPPDSGATTIGIDPTAATTNPHHSSLLELDILRNLAAAAGTGMNANQSISQSGTNGYRGGGNGTGSVSETGFRPPVKQELTSPNPNPKSTTEFDAARTILSIQTQLVPNTETSLEQISPTIGVGSDEIKYRPSSLSVGEKYRRSNSNGNSGGDEKGAFSAITVETPRSDSNDSAPNRKKFKSSTSESGHKADTMNPDHSDSNAQHEKAIDEAEDEEMGGRDTPDSDGDPDPDSFDEMLSEHGEEGALIIKDPHDDDGDGSPPISHSPPSSETPLSVGGRTGSIGSMSSRSGSIGSPNGNATGTATIFGGKSITLPTTSADDSRPAPTMSSTVTHPPGLAPPNPNPFSAFTAAHHGNHANLHTCHICGFTSPSKFHFNSHMNTHADHKCDFCDYTSRTEGRLKRHMKEFHSPPQGNSAANSNDESSSHGFGGIDPSLEEVLQLQLQGIASGGTSGGNPTSGAANTSFGTVTSSGSTSAASTDRRPTSSEQRRSGGGHGGHGGSSKNKTYRCKQCDYVAKSKDDHWAHSREHIKTDKLLSCPSCQFVTEYKHHLEYHLRNHFGSKPFKCVKCNYSCVNKSMLNSHMKSHSNFYQYRCSDCTYATKYCHSLKLHLRKYAHTPATTITMDNGTVIEGPTLDIYGNRRGPRGKKNGEHSKSSGGSSHRSGGGGGGGGGTGSSGHHSGSSAGGDGHSGTGSGNGGGPLSASLPIASPTHFQTGNGPTNSGFGAGGITPMTLAADGLINQPTMVSSGGMPSSIMEALQNSLLAQVQHNKDLSNMVTSIATLGAQLPTVSLAAALAAAHNQPGTSQSMDEDMPPDDDDDGNMSPEPMNPGAEPMTPTNPMSMANFGLTSPTAASNLNLAATLSGLMSSVAGGQSMKCNLCDFSCSSKELLTKHTMMHVMEKPELYQVYSLIQAQAMAAAAAAALANSTSQQSTSGASSSCGSTSAINELKSSSILDEQRFLLSHDLSQDSNGGESPMSASGGKLSGDEGMGGDTFVNAAANVVGHHGSGHRQRRKGRAFKLDRIALKLQGKNSDDGDDESMADTEETGGGNHGDNGGENFDTAAMAASVFLGGNRGSNLETRHTRSTSPCSQSMTTGHRVNRSESVSSAGGIGRAMNHPSSNTPTPISTTPADIQSSVRSQSSSSQHQPQNPQQPIRNQISPSAYPSPLGRPINIDWSNAYVCNYCEIAFKDCIMYTMHMGFHGYQDPYKCNTCGQLSDDARSMFLHIAREPHL